MAGTLLEVRHFQNPHQTSDFAFLSLMTEQAHSLLLREPPALDNLKVQAMIPSAHPLETYGKE